MENLIFMNREGTFSEIVNDFDFGSFKYEYEQNNERSISLTAYKTNVNADIFDSLINENYLIWKGQKYVIKSTELKYEEGVILNEIEAKHISMEFQNHYVPKDLDDESLNDEDETETKISMKVKEYLDFAFKNNKLNFDYKLHGKFNESKYIEQLGDKNGLEHLIEGAEHFGYIFFADNKTFHIYTPDNFYKKSDEILVYKYNNSSVSAKTITTELRTYIQGYGKKKSKSETKNYKPIKPKDFSYSGNFNKEGTWSTEHIGDSFYKTFDCKWGNETLTWNLKKGPKGGIIEVFIDDKSKGTFDCYSAHASTQKVILAKGLSKGKHSFRGVFKSKKPGIDYKKSNPVMYVGTSKSSVLNLTAVLKGKDIYHVYAEYKSPYYKQYGKSEAPTIYDDNITSQSELKKKLKETLDDIPTIEVATNYLGLESIHENNTIRFIHKPIGFNTDLKVVKLTEYHPLVSQPIEVEFSNAQKDIIQMQSQFNRRLRKVNNLMKKGFKTSDYSLNVLEEYNETVGSVLIDE